MKKDRYAAMGVREFWLLELAGRQRAAQLQGFRLERGQYLRLAPLGEDGPPTIRSEVLGLDLWLDGELLRVRDSQTGAAALAGRAEEAMTLAAATQRQADVHRGRKTDTRRHQTEANRQTESHTRRATETHLRETEAVQRNEAKALRDAEARVAELEARIQILERSHPWNQADR